jgi:transposase
VAEQLGLIAQTLRNWVKAAERGRLNHKARKVSEEQMELSRLRGECWAEDGERDPKKATAYPSMLFNIFNALQCHSS